ncbi:hypothetical protein HDU88_002341 [Geranomyces variabilis]|nr:hypothetical protein HDU88_002341 [Geranomyces variabilis]
MPQNDRVEKDRVRRSLAARVAKGPVKFNEFLSRKLVRRHLTGALPSPAEALIHLIEDWGFSISPLLADYELPGVEHLIVRVPHVISLATRPSNFRTRACRNWTEKNYCRNGDQCAVVHVPLEPTPKPGGSHNSSSRADAFVAAGQAIQPQQAPSSTGDSSPTPFAPLVRRENEATFAVPASPPPRTVPSSELIDTSVDDRDQPTLTLSRALASLFRPTKASHEVSSSDDQDARAIQEYFLTESKVTVEKQKTKVALLSKSDLLATPQYGYIGKIVKADGERGGKTVSSEVYLNTHDPFCLVTLGVQGAGKSHTVATLIESCMLHCPPFLAAQPPVKTMVFHFDQDASNICEAGTMTARHSTAPPLLPVV